MREKILSVGIDIGTSTTCVIFSHLVIENIATFAKLPEAEIVEKDVIYRSPIYFTPLISNTELNVDEIMRIVKAEYEAAGIDPGDVETGAVIITGDTARKSNAKNVVEAISQYAGDFVVATVGPELESILAGKGSGAEFYSLEHTESIANFDIGGGTTNIATFYNGKVEDADCMDVGGRLIRFKPGGTEIEYIFPKLQDVAKFFGINADMGDSLSLSQITQITDFMAKGVMEKLLRKPKEEAFFKLSTKEKNKETFSNPQIDAISFSGGVGDLIYMDEFQGDLIYGDIGVLLAKSIKGLLKTQDIKVVMPAETIGATVIGAGNCSMEVSGATITISPNHSLPLKNIPIVSMRGVKDFNEAEFINHVRRNLDWIQGNDSEKINVALAVDWGARMSFQDVQNLAAIIGKGLAPLISNDDPLIVVLKEDYGKVLGQSLQSILPPGKAVFCIDGVDISAGDYLDIGKPLGVGDAVPVVVKTLAFSY